MSDTNDLTNTDGDLGWEQFLNAVSTNDLPSSIERLVYDVATGKKTLSDTPGLVDENGVLQTVEQTNFDGSKTQVPFYYDLDRDPQAAYNSLSPERRQYVLDVLADRGIPTGTWQQNVRAFEVLYGEANRFGKTVDVMLADIIEKVPATEAQQTRVAPYRVSSSQDLSRIVKDVAKSTIGRTVSDDVAQQFVAWYQSQQQQYQQRAGMQSGGVIEDLPSADVAAQSFVQDFAPTEAQGYQFLGYADQFFNSLRGRF